MKRLSLFVGALVASVVLMGAVTPNSFVTPQTPNLGIVQFLEGTDAAGTYKTVYTAGANGSRCYAIWLTTNDGTATHPMSLAIFRSSTEYKTAAVTSTLLAGQSNGVPPNDMLAAFGGVLQKDQYGNQFLPLNNGDTIQAKFATALTAGTLINVLASCSDF